MRKSLSMAALVALTASPVIAMSTTSAAQAADSSCTTTVPAGRTGVTITNADGGSELGAGWEAKIGVNLSNLDGCAAGAKAVVSLPKEIALGQVGKVVPIKDGDGNRIANATISADSVTIELTDFAATHQNVSAHFEAWASASEALNTTKDVTLTWTVNGETVTTVVKGQPSVGVPKGQMPDELGKGGNYNADTNLIRVGVRTPINHNGTPFTVNERLTTGGQVLDCGALDISGDQFSAVNEQGDEMGTEDMDVKVVSCNDTLATFVVNPKTGYAGHIYFNAKVTEPSAGVWKDTVDAFQNGVKVGSASARVIDYGASGGGSGEGIPLPPTDEPTTPPTTDTPSETPTTPPTTDTPTETPSTPTEPTTPTDTPTTDTPSETPTTPTEPTTPTDTPTTDTPTEPTTPSETPTEPTAPPTTDTPSETPTEPTTDKPSEPTKPSEPATPPVTGKPGKSSTPETSTDKPSEPAKSPAPSKGSNAPSGAKSSQESEKPVMGPQVQTDNVSNNDTATVWIAGAAVLLMSAALALNVIRKVRK